MTTTADRALPYPIKLPAGQAAAELHVGWRSYPVQVVDISWQAITVSLPAKVARRIRLNSKTTLWHQGNEWRAIADQPCKSEGGKATLHLTLADSLDPRLQRILKASKTNATVSGEQNINSDPLIWAVFAIGLVLAVLVMPGWGDELGTSKSIPTAVQEFFKAVGGTFGKALGR